MNKILTIIFLLSTISIFSKNCVNPSWRTKEECQQDEGNWIDESGYSCESMKSWNPQPEGTVCCAGCTDDSLEEMGMD